MSSGDTAGPGTTTAPDTAPTRARRFGRPRTVKGGDDSRHLVLLRYLGVRLLLIPVTAWILVTVVFFLMRVVGDPISAALGGRMTQEQIEVRKEAAGLNRPILAQYWDYLSGLMQEISVARRTTGRSARSSSPTAPPRWNWCAGR